ncbi:hypothetical protein QZH41_020655 [Actinostola sp. cb2023]|nr:hypothetical protein QZH41_020655 [Actinostola sp. cb2023]
MDVHFIRWLLLTSANKEGNINIKEFTDHYFITHKETAKTSLLEKEIVERAKKFSDYIDPENSGFITRDKVESFSLEKMKEILVLYFDPCDVSNTEDFEYSHIQVEDIKYEECDDILEAFSYSLDDMGYFGPKIFIQNYEELGGSVSKGNEIIKNLELNGRTKLAEIMDKADAALHKYQNSPVHDPSFEHKMIKHLSQHEEL